MLLCGLCGCVRFPSFVVLCLLLSCILLLGCVAKSIYPSESETISKERSIDVDNDGVPDQIIYVFEPKAIGNVSVQREMLVERGVGNLVVMRLTLISEASGQFTDVTLREIIPAALATRLDVINFTTRYSEVARREPPMTVVWKYTFSGSERIVKTIEYGVVAYQDITRSWVERNIRSPDIEVGVIDPRTAAFFLAARDFNEDLFSSLTAAIDFYVAVAIYASILFFLFILAIEVLSIVGAYLAALVKRVSFGSEVYGWIGHGRKDNMLWVIAGVVLVIAGGALIALTTEVSGSQDMATLARIGTNLPKATGSIVAMLGFVSILYVALDLAKGVIFGKRYFLEPMDVARGLIDTLLRRLEELEGRVAEVSTKGIDTSTESLIHQIELARSSRICREINEDNVDLFMPVVTKSISDVEAAIDGLGMKMEVGEHWPSWSAIIDELLSKKEQIAPADLEGVPEHWRKWALARYHSEHIGEALALEGGILRKIKIAAIGKAEIASLLADFLRAAKIEGTALVRKDGLVISARLPSGIDQNLVAAVAAKVVANAEMVSSELGKGNTRFTIIKSSGQETVIYEGAKVILLALVKPGEQTGYVISETEKVMQKLNEMF